MSSEACALQRSVDQLSTKLATATSNLDGVSAARKAIQAQLEAAQHAASKKDAAISKLEAEVRARRCPCACVFV